MNELGVPTLKDEVLKAINIISFNKNSKKYFFDLIRLEHRVFGKKYEDIFRLIIEKLEKNYEILGKSGSLEIYGKDVNEKKVCVKVEAGLYLDNNVDDIYEGLWDIYIVRNDDKEFYPEFEICYYNIYNCDKKKLNQQIESIVDSIKIAFKMPSNIDTNLKEKIDKIIPLESNQYNILTGKECEELCNNIILKYRNLLEEELADILGCLGDAEYYNKK